MPQVSIRVRVRVPFPDVDSSGRIHFTAMLRYMEIAEHELVRAIGFPRATTLQDIAFPRVHVDCDYLGAVAYDDELHIEARVEHVGRSSWSVAFTARLIEETQESEQEGGTMVARGLMTIVATDPETRRARSLPVDFRQALVAN